MHPSHCSQESDGPDGGDRARQQALARRIARDVGMRMPPHVNANYAAGSGGCDGTDGDYTWSEEKHCWVDRQGIFFKWDHVKNDWELASEVASEAVSGLDSELTVQSLEDTDRLDECGSAGTHFDWSGVSDQEVRDEYFKRLREKMPAYLQDVMPVNMGNRSLRTAVRKLFVSKSTFVAMILDSPFPTPDDTERTELVLKAEEDFNRQVVYNFYHALDDHNIPASVSPDSPRSGEFLIRWPPIDDEC